MKFGFVYSPLCLGPGTPQEFSATPVDSRTIELTWQPPPSDELNGVIRQYVVNVTDLATKEQHIFTTMEMSMRVEMLHPFYSYLCSVAAETSVGQGPYSTRIVHLPADSKLRVPSMKHSSRLFSVHYRLSRVYDESLLPCGSLCTVVNCL